MKCGGSTDQSKHWSDIKCCELVVMQFGVLNISKCTEVI